mmetsp:Transcript_6257/g.12054  ORF Transcript_6257/g.12054 Transcript_6257/m.12054 type:complete len:280 (+) Transcript_6257:236-1075(+)
MALMTGARRFAKAAIWPSLLTRWDRTEATRPWCLAAPESVSRVLGGGACNSAKSGSRSGVGMWVRAHAAASSLARVDTIFKAASDRPSRRANSPKPCSRACVLQRVWGVVSSTSIRFRSDESGGTPSVAQRSLREASSSAAADSRSAFNAASSWIRTPAMRKVSCVRSGSEEGEDEDEDEAKRVSDEEEEGFSEGKVMAIEGPKSLSERRAEGDEDEGDEGVRDGFVREFVSFSRAIWARIVAGVRPVGWLAKDTMSSTQRSRKHRFLKEWCTEAAASR